MVLLPQGKIINNPDTVKLVKVLPTTLGKESFFVVTIKLDDDSELMVERCPTRMEAERIADQCCRLLNGEEVEEVPSFVEEDSLDSEESSEDSSSDWDDSSEEASKEETPTKSQEADEESSSWGMSSEDVSPAPSKPQKKSTKKPTIQQPYEESAESSKVSKKQKKKKSAVKMKSMSETPNGTKSGTSLNEDKAIEVPVPKQVPRVTSFIEGDSDEWIPDNGFDDWYE